jgi:2-polyprenyl-3-methyl-5-hydroxy-6-metoxy-1,4-benzoquinol methylase
MFINTTYRSNEPEIMDDFTMEGDVLQNTLDKIAVINKKLGGNKITISGVEKLLKKNTSKTIVTIIDIGCGNGDMLRALADYGKQHHFNLQLMGIDANDYTINYARKLSVAYPQISFNTMDVLSKNFGAVKSDIVVATLFLHHFKNNEIQNMLVSLTNNTSTGIVINDLHRCRTAYYLFKLISLFIKNVMVRNDGAISVLRGFKKKELQAISKQLPHTQSTIQWKWAFRYQWIIQKL